MAGITEGLGLTGTSLFISQYWAVFLFYTIFGFSLFASIIFLYVYYWKNNIEIKIFSKRGGLAKGLQETNSFTIKVFNHYGHFKETDGTRQLHLFLTKKHTSLVNNKYVYAKSGLFRKWIVFLLEDDIGDLHPITLAELEQVILRPDSQLNRSWVLQEIRNRDNKYASTNFFTKYANILLPMTFVMVFFVITLILLFQMKDISSSLNNVASALSSFAPQAGPILQ